MSRYRKRADAVLDFVFDLAALTNGREGADADYLATGETIDTIDALTVETGINLHDGSTVYDGVTKAAPAKTDTNTSVTYWLSGGTIQSFYTVTLEFTTTDGRTDVAKMVIQVY